MLEPISVGTDAWKGSPDVYVLYCRLWWVKVEQDLLLWPLPRTDYNND